MALQPQEPAAEPTAELRVLEPVTLHVYDLTEELAKANKVLKGMGTGVYHAAVEVYGFEWSFGFCEEGTGVFSCEPKANPCFCFRQSIVMGHTKMSESEVDDMITELQDQWPGAGYDLLTRNCCDFSNEFCKRLAVGPLPGWVKSAAGVGAFVNDVVRLRHLQEVVKRGRRCRGRDSASRNQRGPILSAAGTLKDFGVGAVDLAKWQVGDVLAEGKQARGAADNEGYKFGDFCRGVISGTAKDFQGLLAQGRAARDAEGEGYRFGDLTRGAVAAMAQR